MITLPPMTNPHNLTTATIGIRPAIENITHNNNSGNGRIPNNVG